MSAIAASDIWAVGCSNYECNEIGAQTLTEHWNGSAWSIVPSPNPNPDNEVYNLLAGIAYVSASDVWAVGDVWVGRVAFALGVSFALAAVLAALRGRWILAAALAPKLARRWSLRRVLLAGCAGDLVSMSLLVR